MAGDKITIAPTGNEIIKDFGTREAACSNRIGCSVTACASCQHQTKGRVVKIILS